MAGEDRIGAGFRYIFYGIADANGFLQGNSATPATNGTIQPMLRLRGAQTFPVEVPDRDRVPVSGDDEPLVTFSFASEELPSGVLATAIHDLEFEALAQGTVAQTIGNLKFGALAPSGQSHPTMMLLLQREAKKFEGATKGPQGWEIQLVAAAEVSPLGGQWQQRTFNPYNYAVSLSKAARGIYGATYTEALRGTTEMAIEPVFSDNPIMIEGGYGDASATTWTLSYTPVSGSVLVFINGVRTISGVSVSGRVVTTPIVADGTHIGIIYEVAASGLS